MHLNRHTPHALHFGVPKYGGLFLPDHLTDQGYGQLKLLIGHLKSKDQMVRCSELKDPNTTQDWCLTTLFLSTLLYLC